MRRLKSDVLKELPEKVIQDYSCSLTKIQRKIYEKIVDSCIGVGKTHNKSEKHDEMLLSPLQVLILLRKLVDHPILIYETLKNSDKDLIKEVTTVSFFLLKFMLFFNNYFMTCVKKNFFLYIYAYE